MIVQSKRGAQLSVCHQSFVCLFVFVMVEVSFVFVFIIKLIGSMGFGIIGECFMYLSCT